MSEEKQMVLTAVGPDAPGRVRQVSSFIHQHGCNLEDSRMAMLAGEFALIVLFTGDAEAIEAVRAGREQLEKELGFLITLKDTRRAAARSDCLGYELRVGGVDQKGIVAAISQALASLEINVVSLESRIEPAAFSGTPMFALSADIQVPGRRVVASLRADLERICDERNLSYSLEPTDLPRS